MQRPPGYQLTLIDYPAFLHARGSGQNTVENALRFLTEAFVACSQRGQLGLLIEKDFRGPSLDNSAIFRVIEERSVEGTKLRKIAYVESSPSVEAEKARFAETVAVNRGVNVRLFADLAEAKAWLAER